MYKGEFTWFTCSIYVIQKVVIGSFDQFDAAYVLLPFLRMDMTVQCLLRRLTLCTGKPDPWAHHCTRCFQTVKNNQPDSARTERPVFRICENVVLRAIPSVIGTKAHLLYSWLLWLTFWIGHPNLLCWMPSRNHNDPENVKHNDFIKWMKNKSGILNLISFSAWNSIIIIHLIFYGCHVTMLSPIDTCGQLSMIGHQKSGTLTVRQTVTVTAFETVHVLQFRWKLKCFHIKT